jgi:hypothetical protein
MYPIPGGGVSGPLHGAHDGAIQRGAVSTFKEW